MLEVGSGEEERGRELKKAEGGNAEGGEGDVSEVERVPLSVVFVLPAGVVQSLERGRRLLEENASQGKRATSLRFVVGHRQVDEREDGKLEVRRSGEEGGRDGCIVDLHVGNEDVAKMGRKQGRVAG